MSSNQVRIEGNTLRLVNDGTIAVSLVKNTRNQWRWYSSLLQRGGRSLFDSQAKAVNAAVKSLGLELV